MPVMTSKHIRCRSECCALWKHQCKNQYKWTQSRTMSFLVPLASEHTARKPSSVSILNKGLTPYVSLPRKTFLLAVSSSTKANTPSSSDAIFSMPKRSYRWRMISPSTLVWCSNSKCFFSCRVYITTKCHHHKGSV